MNNYKNSIDLAFLLALSLLLLTYTLIANPIIIGDGFYYFSTLIGISDTYWPSISDLGREEVISRFGFDAHTGLVSKVESGTVYAWHFWFYSFICMPAYLVLNLIGLDGLKAFQITNAVLIIFCCCYVLLYSGLDRLARWFIVLMFLFSTGFIYLQWTHPEVFSTVFLIVACGEFLKKRYLLTTVFAAIASFQNPSIALFLFPVFSIQFYSYFHYNNKKIIQALLQFIPTMIVALLVFIPYLWNYFIFGSYNPIATSGYINYSDIGFDRFYSFLFDLNQGFLIGFPGLFIVFFVVLFLRLYNFYKGLISFQPVDILLVSFVLIVIPLLAQLNWNPGQSISLRYITWASVPLLFWVSVNINYFKNFLFNFFLLFGLAIQVFLNLYMGGVVIERHPSHVALKPWIHYVWNLNPNLYNPIPEIFYERLLGKEEIPITHVVYKSSDNEFLKILTKDTQLVSHDICGVGGELSPVNSRKSSQISIVKVEHGFYYVNGRLKCIFKIPVKIKNLGVGSVHFVSGWSDLESWGVWSSGKEASIKLDLVTSGFEKIKVEFIGTAFVSDFHPQQAIDFDYGRGYRKYNFTSDNSQVSFIAEIDSENLNDIVFKFKFPDAISPQNLGMSNDSRKLAFGLREINVTGSK